MKPNAYRANEEIRMKAELSRKEAESLIDRDLKCPECGYKADTVFSDCTGHLTIRCRKCKTVSVLNLAYFRRHRRRKYKTTIK